VHGDTPGAVGIARAVRGALDEIARAPSGKFMVALSEVM